jgi:hypothetical protein
MAGLTKHGKFNLKKLTFFLNRVDSSQEIFLITQIFKFNRFLILDIWRDQLIFT